MRRYIPLFLGLTCLITGVLPLSSQGADMALEKNLQHALVRTRATLLQMQAHLAAANPEFTQSPKSRTWMRTLLADR